MAKFEFIENVSDEYFYVDVEVGFARDIVDFDANKVLNIFSEAANHPRLKHLVGFLMAIQIDSDRLYVRYKYLSSEERLKRQLPAQTEDLSRQSMQFLFYLFAKVDTIYPLDDIPFPSSFRDFITLPEELD